MVGLPARGKSTLANRICSGLAEEGIPAKIFNNGELRRSLLGQSSTPADFYNPTNESPREAREYIAKRNMERAHDWLAQDGSVAILDATNASAARRKLITDTLTDYPVLFVECVNEDHVLQQICIERKTLLPEFKDYTKEEALKSFMQRIHYYEAIYEPLCNEKYWLRVDYTANKILEEHALSGSPYYSAVRQTLVDFTAKRLFLARHGQTEYNVEGRIGGDPHLTAKGRAQAEALAASLTDEPLEWVFTSTRIRSHETSAPVLRNRENVQTLAIPEFDELWAGDCEGMLYSEISEKMPEVTRLRNADKFNYCYPNGESYAMLTDRVKRGLRRVLFLASDKPLLIIGHQAINRVLISLFLRYRNDDVPYIFIPQSEYYFMSMSLRRKLFERIPYDRKK